MEQTGASAHPRGRLIGLVYLLYVVASPPSLFLLQRLVLPNDAAGTARNILANEMLYQLSVSFGIVANLLYIALIALFYDLLKPVGPRVALCLAFFGLAGAVVQLAGALLHAAPLIILNNAHLLGAFQPEQIYAGVMLSLKMYSQVSYVSFVLFGLFDLCMGWLIFRSTFLPRFIGILFMFGGLCGLVFLWPPLATRLLVYLVASGGLGELVLLLWLLAMGVNISKWKGKIGLSEVEN